MIADKQRRFARYLDIGIIEPNDCAVIAINICRLSDWDVDGHGISQLPLSMEAVFPIGPLGVPISRDGLSAGLARHLPRFAIAKPKGVQIQTGNFLDPAFGNISAVIQAHQKYVMRGTLALSMIHNPLAANPLSRCHFGCCSEFIAEPQDGDRYHVIDLLADKV